MKYLTGSLLALCLTGGLSLAAADPVDNPPPQPAPAVEHVEPPPPPPKPKPKPRPKPASFDCRDAFEESEKLICTSFELARLDQQMLRAFNNYMDSLGPDQGLTAQSAELAQRRFVIERSNCYDEDCIRSVYGERIRTLRSQHNTNMGLRR
ncbi:hypothetical protein [Emcibacter sp. SYSU 3D8]|uniref:lysozyme inhibitor LprI family protein n=1 Tax=Emcibacter sp. SYSU 3D8 TaxID=3133969 RepID=UPI0031FE7F02